MKQAKYHLAHNLAFPQRSPFFCIFLIALLAVSACNREDSKLDAAVASDENRASGRQESSANSNHRKQRNQARSRSKDPLVNAREDAKVLAQDYVSGRISADEALAQLLGQEKDDLAARAWYEFLGSIRPEDMEKFFTALREKGDSGIRAQMLPALVGHANSLDPKLAGQLIDTLPEGSLRMGCIHALFLGDPRSVLQHAELLSSLTTDRDTMALGGYYSDALSKLDSEAIRGFVSNLADGRAKSLALTALASKLGEESQSISDLSQKLATVSGASDRFQEAAFLKQLEEGKEKNFSGISLGVVESSQQAALAYAAATMIHRHSDAPGAMEWLWSQGGSEAEVTKGAVHATMVRWLNSDPIAASKWLGDQPAGQFKDVALRPLIQYLDADYESEERAAWIQQLSDPELIKHFSHPKSN